MCLCLVCVGLSRASRDYLGDSDRLLRLRFQQLGRGGFELGVAAGDEVVGVVVDEDFGHGFVVLKPAAFQVLRAELGDAVFDLAEDGDPPDGGAVPGTLSPIKGPMPWRW